MYSEEPVFKPHINRASRTLGIAPLADRCTQVVENHQRHIAQLAEEVESARQRNDTFAPKINATAGTFSRVPLAERTNVPRGDLISVDAEATHKPQINEVSRQIVSDCKRGEIQAQYEIRRRIRELWTEHAEGVNMSADGVVRVLASFGLDDPAFAQKFFAALGMSDTNRYAEYEQFSRVFGAVLRSAVKMPDDSSLATTQPMEPSQKPEAPPDFHERKPLKRPTAKTVTPRSSDNRAPMIVDFAGAQKWSPSHSRQSQQPRSPSEQRKTKVVKSTDDAALEKCTFAPQNLNGPPPMELAPRARGFSDIVHRLARARENTRPKFEEILRSSTENDQKAAPGKPTTVQPFHLVSEERAHARDKPYLYVDVDMPNGRCGRIGIHDGDNPTELARNFCMTYCLDVEMQERLTELLRNQIATATRKATREVPRKSPSGKCRTLWV